MVSEIYSIRRFKAEMKEKKKQLSASSGTLTSWTGGWCNVWLKAFSFEICSFGVLPKPAEAFSSKSLMLLREKKNPVFKSDKTDKWFKCFLVFFMWRSGLKSTALEISAPLSTSIKHDDPLFGLKLRHNTTADLPHQFLYIRSELYIAGLTVTTYALCFYRTGQAAFLFAATSAYM